MEVMGANSSSPAPLQHLRHRCLLPGRYHTHITNWLRLFPPHQVLLLDGEMLASSPAEVMREVQLFLKMEVVVDYTTLLR